jgi:hypothetical protein
MSIGKRKTSGGEFLPRFKIDGRSAAMSLEDRVKENGEWKTKSQNVPYGNLRAIVDIANLQRGYADFTGRVPDMEFFPLGKDIGDPPTPNHKEGIRVLLLMDTSLGGAVRELISTGIAVYDSFDALHTEWESGLDPDHPDYLPVVECDGIREEKIGNGVSAAPIWKIVNLVPRPPELPAGGIPLPKPAAKAADDAAGEDVDHELAEAIEEIEKAQKQIASGGRRSGAGGMDDPLPF